MNSIVYVGMDVHKESYTLCCYSYDTDKVEYKQTIPSDYDEDNAVNSHVFVLCIDKIFYKSIISYTGNIYITWKGSAL